MALHVLEAVRVHASGAVVVAVSSGEVYGRPEALPVAEDAPLRPQNPYAVSKAARGPAGPGSTPTRTDCRSCGRARSTTPGRASRRSTRSPRSRGRSLEGWRRATRRSACGPGNPDVRRDYTDVRDVVRAYRLLAASGPAGAVNVCSGSSSSASELVARLASVCGVEVEHVVDPALVRAHEVLDVRGDASRLRELTGWEAQFPLERTLADSVAWWRDQLRAGPAAHG